MINNEGLVPDRLYQRNPSCERTFGVKDLNLYAYFDSCGNLTLYGEIIADAVSRDFSIECAVYDADDDLIAVRKETLWQIAHRFYNPYPFRIYVPLPRGADIEKIVLDLKS